MGWMLKGMIYIELDSFLSDQRYGFCQTFVTVVAITMVVDVIQGALSVGKCTDGAKCL